MAAQVTGYTAIVEMQGLGMGVEVGFGVTVDYVGGNMTLNGLDAAAFAAVVAVLTTARAEYDQKTNQLFVRG